MKFKWTLILLFLIPLTMLAQRGKVVGTVTDKNTGEPLVGVNIVIEGTFLGTSTDIDGLFLLLNVDPGIYTLRAMYVGYRDMIIENIRVSVNVTTEVNFELTEEALTSDAIVVVAERPLVNKNITNSNSIIKSEDIANLPIRGVNAIVAQEAGIVADMQDNLYVRGSRSDAVSYYVDGVLVNNPVFGGSQTAVITNAIEEIQFQAGGYSAEYGGANGGIISTHTKVGTEKYDVGVELITDNFIGVGNDYLGGGYSFGQSEYILTVGGPLLPSYKNLRFFVAANNDFERSPQEFYKGTDLKGIFDPGFGAAADTFDFYYPDGYRVGAWTNDYNIQGNLTWNLQPITFRLNSSFKRTEGSVGVDIDEYATRSRAGKNEGHTITGSLKMTHVLSTTTFYDVIVNYFNDYYVRMDPIFRHNITAYGDSIENAAVGTQMLGDGQNIPTNDAYGWAFVPGPRPYNLYRKQKSQSIGGRLDFLTQIGQHNEVKFGGEFQRYTIRRYSLSPRSIAALQKSVADGSINDIYNRLDNYGYDVFGNETDSGLERARNPLLGGVYVQDKLEYKDLIVNAGMRLDYFDTDSKEFENPHNVKVDDNGEIDQSTLKDVKPFVQLSPRLGFSFPVTENTVFHAQYGKFYQQSRLRDIYLGYNVAIDNIKGGFAIQNPVGYGLRPERTTSYEIGFKKQLGNNFAFDVTLFYKDIKDQIQSRSIYADEGANHNQYYAFVNGDFSTVKGLDFKLQLRRTNRLMASIDYTYSNAMGTGSNPSSAFRIIWQSPTATPFFPQQIAPLDFNQTHKGNINLDYRYGFDDGPTVLGSKILSGFGANVLFQFNSGFNFTRWIGYGNTRSPLEPLNASTTPWVFQVDARLNKSLKIGPISADVYVWIVNLFNRKNVVDVFNTSGDPADDGWLAYSEGIAAAEGYRQYGDEFVDMYKKVYLARIQGTQDNDVVYTNFATPRQIKLGIRLDF